MEMEGFTTNMEPRNGRTRNLSLWAHGRKQNASPCTQSNKVIGTIECLSMGYMENELFSKQMERDITRRSEQEMFLRNKHLGNGFRSKGFGSKGIGIKRYPDQKVSGTKAFEIKC